MVIGTPPSWPGASAEGLHSRGTLAGLWLSISLLHTGHLIINRVNVRNAISLVKTEVFKIRDWRKLLETS